MSDFNKSFMFSYENHRNIKFINYDDDYIIKTFSTDKYKIGKAFLNFLHKLDYLWLDESYLENYMITPLKNLLLRIEYQERPTTEHTALFINMTQVYLIDNFWRLINSKNIIKTIYGDTGSGKSLTSINEIWIYTRFLIEVLGWDICFSANNICFSRNEVLNLVPILKKGETTQFDEDSESVLGIGSFSSKDFVSRFEKTLRSMSKNFFNLNPTINSHNEHYIVKSLGYNETLGTNKFIFRERDSVFYGFCLMPNGKGSEYTKLLSDYEIKKKKFQNDLENQKGDDSRTKRMLEMAVSIILKYKITYKMKSTFKLLITNEYKLSISDASQLNNLIICLLDSRLEMFKEYKEQVKEFIIFQKDKNKESDDE
jgi:hypothetical protein